jgi:hypothetical protein
MQKQAQVLRVVLASPEMSSPNAIAFLKSSMNSTGAQRRITVCAWSWIRWQTDSYPGFHPEGSQGQIEAGLDIEHSDVLIGIF